jgi:hypothetical protein
MCTVLIEELAPKPGSAQGAIDCIHHGHCIIDCIHHYSMYVCMSSRCLPPSLAPPAHSQVAAIADNAIACHCYQLIHFLLSTHFPSPSLSSDGPSASMLHAFDPPRLLPPSHDQSSTSAALAGPRRISRGHVCLHRKQARHRSPPSPWAHSHNANTFLPDSNAPIALVETEHAPRLSGGTIGKYIGDAIMAFWNSPNTVEGHAAAACAAALEQQQLLAAMRDRMSARGLPPLHARMGLSSGTVLHGNIGSRRRMEWNVIGDEVCPTTTHMSYGRNVSLR